VALGLLTGGEGIKEGSERGGCVCVWELKSVYVRAVWYVGNDGVLDTGIKGGWRR